MREEKAHNNIHAISLENPVTPNFGNDATYFTDANCGNEKGRSWNLAYGQKGL